MARHGRLVTDTPAWATESQELVVRLQQRWSQTTWMVDLPSCADISVICWI